MTRSKPLSINKLKNKQMYALTKMVDAEFVTSNLADPEFAAKVTAELGFSCTAHNVAGARETLGIPSKSSAIRIAKQTTQSIDDDTLKDILVRLAKLEETVDILLLAAKHNKQFKL